MCVRLSVTIVRTGHILAKKKYVYKMTFFDFDICHRTASLRKLYFVTLTYFSKDIHWNKDLPTAANAHSNVMTASTAVLRVAP